MVKDTMLLLNGPPLDPFREGVRPRTLSVIDGLRAGSPTVVRRLREGARAGTRTFNLRENQRASIDLAPELTEAEEHFLDFLVDVAVDSWIEENRKENE